MRLRISFLLASTLTLAMVCVAVLAQQQSSTATNSRAAAPFAADRINKGDDIREINLDDLKKLLQRDGKDTRPLLVNFWATWCDGCREEFPDLVKIDDDYRAKGLNFLSVTVDELEDKRLAVSFIQEMKAKMPVVLLNVADKEPAIHAIDTNWDGALPA